MNLRQFQADTLAWVKWNFPKSGAVHQLIGMSEELGELSRALLVGDVPNQKDSVADMAVFGANFANEIGINIEEALSIALPGDGQHVMYAMPAVLELTNFHGQLCHTYLKYSQGIRGVGEKEIYQAFAKVWYQLEQTANILGFDFHKAIEETWNEVKKRDWVKYPDGGLPKDGSDNSTS